MTLRVVGTLTTMPDRYHKVVETLRTLNTQTYKLDAIYLAIPRVSKRLGVPYPEVPDEIKALCTIVKCDDHGPITKILGGLLREQKRGTVIISFDDDMIYPPLLVERLVKHHREYPNSAIGSSGMLVRYNCPACAITPNEDNFLFNIPKFHVPKEGRRVDSIYGYPGALYVRKFFPHVDELDEEMLKYAAIDDDMFINDDVTISGYLSLNNIERRIFNDIPKVSYVLDPQSKNRVMTVNDISYDMAKFFARMNRAIKKSKELGMYKDPEDFDLSESIVWLVTVVVLSVLFIIAIATWLVLDRKY